MQATLEADKRLASLLGEYGVVPRFRAATTAPLRFGHYSTRARPGTVVRAGRGKTIPAGRGQGHWVNYDVSNGLGGVETQAILQDREGYLWFGTYSSGVSRYDGQAFKMFTKDDGLADNWIRSIYQDRDGVFWFGSPWGVLSSYDGKTWTGYTADDGLARGNVNSILQDRAGDLWFGTSGGGASRYNGQAFMTYRQADGLASDDVNALLEDREGRLWFGMRNGASRYDGRRFTSFDSEDGLIHDNVLSLLLDREGNIWFGTPQGTSRFDGRTWESYTTQDGLEGRIIAMFQDRRGDMWFGTRDDGLYRFDGNSFESFTTADGLADNRVFSILQDGGDNLWFGTDGGVSRYTDETFTTYRTAQGLGHNRGSDAFQDRDGNLWFSTNGGVVRYDGRTFTTYTTEDGLPSNIVRSIFQDRDGYFWFGTLDGGLSRYDGRTFRTYTTKDGLASNVLYRQKLIAQDREGNLWFGTEYRGVTRYDGRRFETFTAEDGLASDLIWSVVQDRKGNLWFGTAIGVSRFDGESFESFTVHDGLADNYVRSVFEDRDGNLWFGTWGGGVTRYRPPREGAGGEFTTFTTKDGLAHNAVLTICEDAQGHLWFGTDGGVVSRYDGQVFQTLTREDGLTGQSVRTILRDRDENVWMVTFDGIVRYRAPEPKPPSVFIDAVVADRRQEKVESFAISSDTELAAFEFRGMSFKTRPGAMVYRYRLNPYHDWRTTREQRVEYQDLPRGDYTFEVVAVDRDLVYSESPAVVALTVHIPYERVGVWSGLIVAIVLVGWQTARVVRRDRRLRVGNQALSDANKELFQVNVDLQREQAQGMQSSEDIKPVVEAVYRELTGMGLPLLGPSIGIYRDDEMETEIWEATPDGVALEPWINEWGEEDPIQDARRRGDDYYHRHWEGEDLRRTIRRHAGLGNPLMKVLMKDLPEEQWPQEVETYHIFFDTGRVQLTSEEPIAEEYLMLIKRFGEVFGYAHSRYKELQEKEAQNRRLAVEASVQRLRAEVQSMDEASDFERILSLLTESLKTVELSFDGCEIDVLDEPVENPTMELFETNGFRYTTFRLDPDGNVATNSYNLAAPFPTVNERTIERFIEGQPWQGTSEGEAIVEVPAGAYGRLRLTATDRQSFADDEVATLREFADAVALGYARYLDIRKIQEATERKSAFLASMSHELRTPMNAIKGFARRVLRASGDILPDRQKENLQKVDQASDHLLAMLNDLLDLSKIEAGRMDVNPERFDVGELVTSACDTVSPLIQEGVELRQDVADDIGEVNTDKARLQQMVINLLSNAIKFTDSGSVSVSASQADGQLVIAVSDTGKGIPADELPTIFDEYRQVEGSESSVQKGTGLGLSITKKFAELLGGTIGVESEVGKGSTFTVRVPVVPEEELPSASSR